MRRNVMKGWEKKKKPKNKNKDKCEDTEDKDKRREDDKTKKKKKWTLPRVVLMILKNNMVKESKELLITNFMVWLKLN